MARTRKDEKELTWDRSSYVITCGAELKNNIRKPKVWRLGDDLREANLHRVFIKMAWSGSKQACSSRGINPAVWLPEYLEQARQFHAVAMEKVEGAQKIVADFNAKGNGSTTPANKPSGSNAQPRKLPEGTVTLQSAIDAYGQKLDEDVRTTERVEANAKRQKCSLKVFVRFISDAAYNPDADTKLPMPKEQETEGLKKMQEQKQAEYFQKMFSEPSPIKDRPLAEVSYDQCKAAVTNLKQRRVSGYSPYTIRDTVQHTKQFFDWCEETGIWKPTFNTVKVLQVDTHKLMTLAEVTELNSGHDTFTVAELTTLYQKANDSQRLWLLLGCNLVCTQQQISDLMMDNIDLENGSVNFVRGKTRTVNKGRGVSGSFLLWHETLELLAARMRTTPKNKLHLALLSEEGKPVVGGIKLSWDKLLEKVGALRPDRLEAAKSEAEKNKTKFKEPEVRWLPYSTLRKTISTMVKELAGEAVQQQALAHAPTTVAGKHYSGKAKFDSLEDVMQHIHDVSLKAVFQKAEEKVAA